MIGQLWRTRVYQFAPGRWRVDYYMPYSGRLYVDYETWDEAMQEACQVEEQKLWT